MKVHNWLNLVIYLDGDERFKYKNASGFEFICTRVHLTLDANESLDDDVWIHLEGPGIGKADGRILHAVRSNQTSIRQVPGYVEKVIREKYKKMEAFRDEAG